MIGPSLAKARGLPLLVSSRPVLVRVSDGPLRELFDRADIVSEGSVREEAGTRIWYGSTSMILGAGDAKSTVFAGVAGLDVHLRVRALRTARREACVRAPSRLGRFTCEIRVAACGEGLRIDVDVQAPLIADRRAFARAT
ncbi:MAG: hypothetical protein ACREJ3_04530 [Polyangiaceae bacterium]